MNNTANQALLVRFSDEKSNLKRDIRDIRMKFLFVQNLGSVALTRRISSSKRCTRTLARF